MTAIFRWGWVVAVLFGIAMGVAGGLYVVAEGRSAHNEVRDTLADERIITAEDAEIPLSEVDTPEEAQAQADVILEHTQEATGGKTYAELERDAPAKAV